MNGAAYERPMLSNALNWAHDNYDVRGKIITLFVLCTKIINSTICIGPKVPY